MATFTDKVVQARKAGYSDAEIITHLSSGEMSAKIKQAQDAGYSATEIVNYLGGAAAPAKDTSFSSALRYGFDQPVENMGVSVEAAGKAVGSATLQSAGKGLRDFTTAPDNYEPAASRFINPQEGDTTFMGFGIGYAPRALVEQAGQLGGSLATRGAGAAIGGAAGSVAGPGGSASGAAAGAFLGPAAFEFIQQVGPMALQRAKNNGRTEPDWTDWTAAAGGAGLMGALNAVGVKGLGSLNSTLLGSMAKEGLTEAGQSLVEQTATSAGTDQGLNVSLKQAVGEGLLGAGGAGTVHGTAGAARAATQAVSDTVNAAPKVMDEDAAISVAKRIVQEARGNELNLKDVDPASENGGAKLATDNVHTQISSEINQIFTELKGILGPDSANLRQVLNKALGRSGKRDAGNKVKNIVAPEEMDAVANLEVKLQDGRSLRLGDTDIGQELIFRLKESNELTRLIRPGMQGGISKFTDELNPIQRGSSYRDPLTVMRLMGTAAGAMASPVIPALQTGAFLGGRAIDALTGRRSRVNRFVQAYADQNFDAPATRAEQSYFTEKAAAEAAIQNAKTAAEAAKAEAKLKKLEEAQQRRDEAKAAREEKQRQRDVQNQLRFQERMNAQRDRESRQTVAEQTKAARDQQRQTEQTMRFQERMNAQRAAEERAAQQAQEAATRKNIAEAKAQMGFQRNMNAQQAREVGTNLRSRMALTAQRAREEVMAEREALAQEAQSGQQTFDSALAKVHRIMRVKAALQRQRDRIEAQADKAKTAAEKKAAQEAERSVKNRQAAVDAAIKAQQALAKVAQSQQFQQEQQMKADPPPKSRRSYMSEADQALFAKEGGVIRSPIREQRGTERIQRMQEEAIRAADAYPDQEVGLQVVQAVEMLADNLRGPANNARRKQLYRDLVESVPEEHRNFVRRWVRGLAYVFDRD